MGIDLLYARSRSYGLRYFECGVVNVVRVNWGWLRSARFDWFRRWGCWFSGGLGFGESELREFFWSSDFWRSWHGGVREELLLFWIQSLVRKKWMIIIPQISSYNQVYWKIFIQLQYNWPVTFVRSRKRENSFLKGSCLWFFDANAMLLTSVICYWIGLM